MRGLSAILPPIAENQLWDLFARAEEVGLRLEMTDSGITWEMLPGLRHQELMSSVFLSMESEDVYRAIDVAIRFPDGTVKRPDISIFCHRPAEEEGFIHLVPEAVVEITSPDVRRKT